MLNDIFWTATISFGLVLIGFVAQVGGRDKRQLFHLSLPAFVLVYGILGLFDPTGNYVGISSPLGGPNHLHPPTMISIGALGLLGLFLLHRHEAKNISNPQAKR